MRRGEAVGLPWRDVDLERAQILVGSQLLDTGLGLDPTDEDSRRRSTDPDRPTHSRGATQAASEQDSRLLGAAWVETGMVCTREDGSWLRSNSVSQLPEVGGLGGPTADPLARPPAHPRKALAAGVDIKVVSERLGHSTTAITQDLYTKVVPQVARTAAEAIADAH
jgi:integrase